jgi:DNA-binding IclR family transcriptional regulator
MAKRKKKVVQSRTGGSSTARDPGYNIKKVIPQDGASSLNKMLGILDLFTPERPIWSTNDLIRVLETSRSTAYRYIKALNTAGLISAVGNGSYTLGPRFVELDLQIRTCDPLHVAAKGILEKLVEATGLSALLCMLFRNSVLCIGECRAPMSPENLFSRGQRRSLFRGAMSKIILAHLPNHRLRSIYARSSKIVAEANLGQSWGEFRENLASIRKEGHVISHGEFHPGIAGVAAPVFNSDQMILGSVGVAWELAELKDVNVAQATMAIKRAAREISQRLASTMKGMDLPPRAVG